MVRHAADSLPSASYSPQSPGPGFGVFVTLWVISLPLFLLGVVLCGDRNIKDYLASSQRRVVFRVLLKADVHAKEATRLAEEWTRTGRWRDSRALPPAELLGRIEDLTKWLADAKNKQILDPLPYVVDLWPVDVLSSRADPSELVSTLKNDPAVDQVFFDREGVKWFRQVRSGWWALRTLLCVVFAIASVAGAFVSGWMGEKLRAGRRNLGLDPKHTPAVETKATIRRSEIILTCSGGVVALSALAGLYGLARLATDYPFSFLSSTAAVGLVGCGIILGVLALSARYWLRNRLVRAILPLLVVLPTAVYQGSAVGDGVRVSTPPRPASSEVFPALPPQTEPLEPALSAATPKERGDLMAQTDRMISERERAIAYLEKWLNRSAEERQLDAQNRQLHQIKMDVALSACEYARMAVKEHYDAAQNYCLALADSDVPILATPAGGPSCSLRALVLRMLVNSAAQSFFLLDIDRKGLADNLAAVEQLRVEQTQLDFFSQLAGVPPEAVEKEKHRLEIERESLLQKRTLLQANPTIPVFPMADTSAAVQDEALVGIKTPHPDENSVGNQIRQRYEDAGRCVSLPSGTLIHAVRDGKVLFASKFVGLGLTVIIEHGEGVSTVYAFLSEILVKPGQTVKAGDYVGSAGVVKPQGVAGIRFEVRKEGRLTSLDAVPGLKAADLETVLRGERR